jgi:PAS domain S-box-containing protein
MDTSSPAIVGSFRSASRSIAAAIVLLALLVIAGRLTEQAFAASVAEPVTLTTGSAVLFLFAGLSLWLQSIAHAALWRRYAAACTAATIALAAATGASGVWDAALARLAATGLVVPPQASVAFLLLGGALALLDWETRRGSRPAQALALTAAAVALVPTVAHLYGLIPQSAAYPELSIHESLALLLLSAAVLLARSEGGVIGIASHDTAGGFLVRWMPAAVLALPLALGWVALQAHQRGGLGVAGTVAALVLTISTFFLLLIFRLARSLDRVDVHRTHAEKQLQMRARQRAGVADLAQRALSGVPIDDLTADALRLVVDSLDVESGEFVEVRSDGTASVTASATRSGHGRQAAAHSRVPWLHRRVLESHEPLIVDDLGRDERVGSQRLLPRSPRNAAVVGVRGGAVPYGTIEVYSERPGVLTNDDLPLLQTIAGILAAARDCRAGEEARRLSEEKFSVVFRASPDAIAIAALSDGVIIDVNPSFLQMTGFTHEDVIGRSVRELGLWLDPEVSPPANAQAPARNVEARFRTKTGRIRVGLCSSEPITLNGEACVLTVVRDISERREAETAVQRANDRLTRWVNELEIRGREISLLNDMGGLLQTCLSPAEVCTVVVRFAQQLLPGSRGAVCTMSEEGACSKVSPSGATLRATTSYSRPTNAGRCAAADRISCGCPARVPSARTSGLPPASPSVSR